MDLNTIFRFAGLPNNALLETTDCVKIRAVSNVTVGIQLENGERLTGEFLPKTTLLEILNNICPNENLESTVLIYMHQKVIKTNSIIIVSIFIHYVQIYGMKSLEETTLKSLGITNGKSILRLIHRSEEQLKTQAHIYNPTIPKPLVDVDMCTVNDTKHSLHSESKVTNTSLSTNEIENKELNIEDIKSKEIPQMQEKINVVDDQIPDSGKRTLKIFQDEITNQYFKEPNSIKFVS